MFFLNSKKETQLGTRLYTALGTELALKCDLSTPADWGKPIVGFFE